MDLKQLHAVIAISEHGSFSAAADFLGTVQSNISTHIRNLERELGTTLIDRSTGELTEEGTLVVARARRVIAELDAMNSDVTALSQEVIGTVRFGAIGTTARWLVPQLLDIAPTRHPRLHLVFIEATTIGLDAQLVNGQVDLGVLALPAPGSEIRTTPLFEEDLVLVVRNEHPLAQKQSAITIADLAGLPLILPLPGTAYRDELEAAVGGVGVKLSPRAEADSVRLIISITFEGTGVSIIPAGAIPSSRRDAWTLFTDRWSSAAPRRRRATTSRHARRGGPGGAGDTLRDRRRQASNSRWRPTTSCANSERHQAPSLAQSSSIRWLA